VAWINLDSRATAARASNEHFAVDVAALIAARNAMQAASEGR
jgi:hypothetical protein